MSGIYSFIKHPMLHLLEISGNMLPGIEKAIAVYYHEQSDQVQGKIIKMKQSGQIEDLHITDIEWAQHMRSENKMIAWLSAENLPFETVDHRRLELNIFDELDYVILSLSFKNDIDSKNDLLFLYLNNHKASFGVADPNIRLSTSEKELIGKMAYNALNSIYQQNILDRFVLTNTNKRIKAIQEENAQLKAEIEQLKSEFEQSKTLDFEAILSEIEETYQAKFVISEFAVNRLIALKGNHDQTRKILVESAINLLNTSFGLTHKTLTINDWDLIIDEFIPDKNDTEAPVSDRYMKTYLLLDKLEDAAKQVIDKNMKLTSDNVGNACPVPISAPAISDALKNHQKKVLNLMLEFPDRWPTIKNQFRPVKNILLSITG